MRIWTVQVPCDVGNESDNKHAHYASFLIWCSEELIPQETGLHVHTHRHTPYLMGPIYTFTCQFKCLISGENQHVIPNTLQLLHVTLIEGHFTYCMQHASWSLMAMQVQNKNQQAYQLQLANNYSYTLAFMYKSLLCSLRSQVLSERGCKQIPCIQCFYHQINLFYSKLGFEISVSPVLSNQ